MAWSWQHKNRKRLRLLSTIFVHFVVCYCVLIVDSLICMREANEPHDAMLTTIVL